MNYSIHEVPGRLQIKTPVMKDNPLRATAAKVYLKALVGILSTEINLDTGSLDIAFDANRVAADAILTLLTERGYLMRLDESAQLLSRKTSISREKNRTVVTHVITAIIP